MVRTADADPGLAEYLRSGGYLVAGGPAFDAVDSSVVNPVSARGLQTDGEWYWPTELAYYVEQYGVLLPEEFVSQALVRKVPPSLTRERLNELGRQIGLYPPPP